MDINDFKAGYFREQFQYKSFSPSPINEEWIWTDAKINTLLSEANLRLGELNAFSLYVPDIDIFIQMHIIKEATTSSRIEGTQTNIEEALINKVDVLPEKRDDWQEVQNYIAAMNDSINQLHKVPVSTRLLKEAHKQLLQGVRGENKLPGEYRTSQNWIGGSSLKDAVFIPPHHAEVSDRMNDLEKFIHNDQIAVPPLIRIAIAHYQFETIHPFLDGNGRLGRLLITLYLVSNGLLTKPTLYLSDYFEKHKGLYYDNLMLVRTQNNLGQWIKFFLVAVIETSKKGIATLQQILKLKERIEQKKIAAMGKKVPRARALMNLLYKTPNVNAGLVEKMLGVSKVTANALINDFVKASILKEVTGYKRHRVFVFQEYLRLFLS
ncbi:MAG: Fic family protein [Ignavibacteriae bacterium]|nr:Fic family protein [Ignavibacteriota bacterium]